MNYVTIVVLITQTGKGSSYGSRKRGVGMISCRQAAIRFREKKK